MAKPSVIDISHWNTIDQAGMDGLKAQGVLGVIHKATENADYFDPTYNDRKAMAIKADLLWGAYHFLRPGDMVAQANWFIDKTGNENILLAADHEDAGVTLNDLKLFLITVENLTGQKAVIYSGNVIKEQVGDNMDPMLENHRLWLAHYSDEPVWPTNIWGSYWLWQYTDKGQLEGIDGELDLDAYGGDEVEAPDLIEEWAPRIMRIAIVAPNMATDKLIITLNGEEIYS
jgi:lysozyme